LLDEIEQELCKLGKVVSLLGQDTVDDVLVNAIVEMDHTVAKADDRREPGGRAVWQVTGSAPRSTRA
jgi:hypothetical protein